MLAKQVIQWLGKRWDGPAVRLKVQGRTYDLGQAGDNPTEVRVSRPNLLPRVVCSPSLGFGEAYMAGDIEVDGNLMDVLEGAYRTLPASTGGRAAYVLEKGRALSRITPRRRAAANAKHHYDLGNDFYRLWLDPSLTYSCAYFLRESDDLETAQRQKLELLCNKAQLEPGQHVLDIGCGWGSLLFHAVRHYDVHATGITPAREQADHIEREARRRGIADRVHVHRGDWRDLRGGFDRIISVGMFEHVGREHYRRFLAQWHDLLAAGGVSVLQTIGRMSPQRPDPWIRRYIFPGGYLPTLAHITSTGADTGLWVGSVTNCRWHYARTLACWAANFEQVRDQVAAERGEPFTRMWWLYLQAAEAAFRWGGLHLWQIVLNRDQATPHLAKGKAPVTETSKPALA